MFLLVGVECASARTSKNIHNSSEASAIKLCQHGNPLPTLLEDPTVDDDGCSLEESWTNCNIYILNQILSSRGAGNDDDDITLDIYALSGYELFSQSPAEGEITFSCDLTRLYDKILFFKEKKPI